MINRLCIVMLIAVSSLVAMVSFDESMHVHKVQPPQYVITQELIPLARYLFAMNHPEIVVPKFESSIPQIIHHIWLGKPLSDHDKQLRKTWQKFHPTWRFVLWTDRVENDVDAVIVYSWQELQDLLVNTEVQHILVYVDELEFDNRTFFDEAINYGEQSDILKYEIVNRVGGMYVDCDFECLKPFDDLIERYDFFTGIQPFDTHIEQLGAALFAAKPHHPILQHAVITIADDHYIAQIIIKTGPIHFTRSFIAMAGCDDNIDIALPATYFYPLGYEQQGQPASVWRRSESYAVHHWAGSWLQSDAFR